MATDEMEEESPREQRRRGIKAKDATEEELEKLVFGDDAGFRDGLRKHRRPGLKAVLKDEDEHGEDPQDDFDDDFTGLKDSELFYVDAGHPEPPQEVLTAPANSWDDGEEEEDSMYGATDPPAWEDSDDERITVSLATTPRLRKLRKHEGEDLVSGTEYTRRLRRQFERLHPAPEWVRYATTQEHLRRRRRDAAAGQRTSTDADDSPVDDMDLDDGELSAQPLADLLRNPGGLAPSARTFNAKRKRLRPEVINIQRTRDVGDGQPSAITSLDFHPTYPMLLSSGPASTMYIHRVSPSDSVDPNPLLTSVHIRHTNITTSAFHRPDGERIFVSGPRRYFHIWDLPSGSIEKVSSVEAHNKEHRDMERFRLSPCGRWMAIVGTQRGRAGAGVVNILDARTTQWIAEVRITSHGGVADFAWWRNGDGLCVAGRAGDMFEYLVSERRVVAQWTDEGAVGTTVIGLGGKASGNEPRREPSTSSAAALSVSALGGDRYMAVGSTSGIVNIYDRRSISTIVTGSSSITTTTTTTTTNHAAVLQSPPSSPPPPPAAAQFQILSPKPLKTIENLTRPVSTVVFSPDGQLLAVTSRLQKDAFRLVHLPSCTVYRNWPTHQTALGRVTAVAFSPDSSLLAVANDAGKLRLWNVLA